MVLIGAVFLKHDRFPLLFRQGTMLLNPRAAPRKIVAPLVGIHIEGSIVEGGDLEVLINSTPS